MPRSSHYSLLTTKCLQTTAPRLAIPDTSLLPPSPIGRALSTPQVLLHVAACALECRPRRAIPIAQVACPSNSGGRMLAGHPCVHPCSVDIRQSCFSSLDNALAKRYPLGVAYRTDVKSTLFRSSTIVLCCMYICIWSRRPVWVCAMCVVRMGGGGSEEDAMEQRAVNDTCARTSV